MTKMTVLKFPINGLRRRYVSALAVLALAVLFRTAAGLAQTPSATAKGTVGTALSVSSPLDDEVFQRQSRRLGQVLVQGHVEAGAGQVEARVLCGARWLRRWRRWTPVPLTRATGEFRGEVPAAAGGFYKVEVRVLEGSRVLARDEVNHVGVGEVFVIAGQSNSTNYGEVRQKTVTRMVSTFDGAGWRIADDPQPGVQDGSTKGSFVPAFGDALYRRYRVPIGVASVGHGSTSVRQWLPAGENVEVMPTMRKYVVRGSDGSLTSDGTLFHGLTERMDELGAHGFRAVLWHQGESDADQAPEHSISPETYRRMMEEVIVSSRRRAGWDVPWIVAEATYHSPSDPKCPPMRAAQRSLWKSGVALEGPDTDTLTARYRQNNGKGVHFNDAGLKAHGELWAQAVERYLNTVLR